jgi:hypothetical protein
MLIEACCFLLISAESLESLGPFIKLVNKMPISTMTTRQASIRGATSNYLKPTPPIGYACVRRRQSHSISLSLSFSHLSRIAIRICLEGVVAPWVSRISYVRVTFVIVVSADKRLMH